MKTRSAKNKGRRLAVKVAENLFQLLKRYYPDIQDDEVVVTPSGINGPDVTISSRLRNALPFDIECKNQEKLNIWSAIEQVRNRNNLIPLVIFSKNREETWVAIEFTVFLRFIEFFVRSVNIGLK